MKKPRVLIYDIETNGVNAHNANLGFVICFGYKWLGEKKTYCLTFDEFDGYVDGGYSDKGLLVRAREIMDEADLLVAHYGDEFDRKFINGRLAINGLPPIPPTKQVDTCKLAWKYFNFSSNRLAHLAKWLGCTEQKAKNEFPDWWMRVLAGDRKTLRKIAEYCKQDVRTTEEVYLKIRPFHEQHIRMIFDRSVCKLCGSPVQYRGFTHTTRKIYRRFVCTNPLCGKWDRESKAVA